MKEIFRYIVIFLNLIRCFPHLLLFYIHKNRKVIRSDTRRWLEVMNHLPTRIIYKSLPIGYIYMLSFYREFRNLVHARVGNWKYFLKIFCTERTSLFLTASEMGEGLFIRHGFATAIGASSIGKNCYVNQQVTITAGVRIMDNVTIFTGVVITGKVRIGNNVIIGANCTITKDVPDNSTVFPPSPRIMQWGNNKPESSAKWK